MNQINLLKNDNEALRSTIEQLYHIIKGLESSADIFFSKNNQKPPISLEKELHLSCSFLEEEESELRTYIEAEIKEIKTLQLDDFAEFVYELKKKTGNALNRTDFFK